MHLTDGFECDDDGFYTAQCTCGWRTEGIPHMETTIDALMEHAALQAALGAIRKNVTDL